MGGAIIATTTIAVVALLVLQASAVLHKHGLAEHQHALAHHTDCSHSRPRVSDRTIGSTLVQASTVPHKHGVSEHPRAKALSDYNPTRPPATIGGYNPTRPPALIGYNPTRPPASDNPIGGTFVALLGAYPGYNGLAPAGTIVVTEMAGGIEVRGTLTGLEASASGGIHIHSGFSCENGADVGGHYYDGLNSDPWTTTYTSDANGVASVRLPVSGFTLWEDSPVAGRALVIQDSSGMRVGCGLLEFSTGQVVHMGLYPGYSGTEVVQGTIVTKETTSGIRIAGTLGGLPASSTVGFHIHSGFSCDDDAGVGGHYFQGLPDDPWTTTFSSDASGAVQISLPMSDFSLFSSMPVMGRTVVVQGPTTKIGCGLIGEAETLAAYMGAYPGSSGTAPSGTVAVTATSDGMLQLRGILTGLEPSATGGIRIHSGFTCGDAGEVGEHYYTGLPSDPWTTTYTSDASGVASVSLDVPGFSLSRVMPVAGRALVVHSSGGTRVGCGLLDVTPGQVAHLGVYPGYAGGDVVHGTIVTTQTSTGIFMSGTVAGLPASTTEGYHIHAGYSCDAADGIYGHYFEGSIDPWTTTYTSDANGAAQISQAMEDFSVYAARPVMGRTYVFHGPSALIGCGVIGYAETLVASISSYPGFTGSAPSGTLQLTETYTGVRLSGVLTGLEASGTGGIRIHSGFTCSDSGEVGGHYYDTSGVVHASDPWTATYTSDANGVASITLDVAGLSISDVLPVAGRAVVVHASAGVRTGCGLLRVTTGQVTPIFVYPGFTGTEAVVGLIVTEDAASGILMSGTLGGLPASATAGFRIHSGYTCSAPAGVGGHYDDGLPSDPWSMTTYTSDASGAAQISLAMSDFSLYSSQPVLSRAIVVHSPTARIGCGVTPPDAGLPATTTAAPTTAAPGGLSGGAIAAIIAGVGVSIAVSICFMASPSAA